MALPFFIFRNADIKHLWTFGRPQKAEMAITYLYLIGGIRRRG